MPNQLYIFRRLLFAFICMFSIRVSAQYQMAYIQWNKLYGGSAADIANSIEATSDGGYIVAGNTASTNGDVTVNHGLNDYWVLKLGNDGTIMWQKSYGDSNNDIAQSVQQTTDGGYIVAGTSSSSAGYINDNHGGRDVWILKIDSIGTMQWHHSFGGSADDLGMSVQQTLDKGYIVSGTTASADGDVTVSHGAKDLWTLKLDSSGILQWQKSYGGSGDDVAALIRQTPDKGYILSGTTSSSNGDVSFSHGVKTPGH